MIPDNLLPIDPPKDYDPGPSYFYNNVVKHLVPDFIRIMNSGLTIDEKAVDELRIVLDEMLKTVSDRLANNQIILDFQAQEYPKKFAEYKAEQEASCRTIDHYLKVYDTKNAVHRTYIVNEILKYSYPDETLNDKWSIKDIKLINKYLESDLLAHVITKSLPNKHTIVTRAMNQLATDKMNIWNKIRTDKVAAVTQDDLLPPFNPGSSLQLRKLFEFLKIAPLKFSKETSEPSWGRDQVEEVLREHCTDPVLEEVLKAFVDYSFSSIVRTTFIEGFDAYTIDGTLHGNFKLFGTKTFRPTSNRVNLLNMPSTTSIYAKPLKKCIVAPPGYVVWTIDYSALEDRVIANLSGDTNKLDIFREGLDGHSLNAVGYFPDKVAKILGPNTDNVAYVKAFKKGVDEGNKDLKKIRQEGKGPTFGLAYGAYPPKIAATIKCSLAAATVIFNNYHDVLYPGITKFREKIVIPSAKKLGYIHMGLGCRMYVDDVDKEARTIFNSASQFWSILTLITIHRLHNEMEDRTDMEVNATIYDAIYGIVKADAESIKWLNDTIVPIMEQDFLENQVVRNEANLEIGPNWADMTELAHDMSEEEVQGVLNEMES